MTYVGYLPLTIQRYLDGLRVKMARCRVCQEPFKQEHDEALCPGCREYSDEALFAAHCEEKAAAMAATNGTL